MYRRLYTQRTGSFLPDKSFVLEGELFNTWMTKIPRAGKLLRVSQRRPDDVVDRETVSQNAAS